MPATDSNLATFAAQPTVPSDSGTLTRKMPAEVNVRGAEVLPANPALRGDTLFDVHAVAKLVTDSFDPIFFGNRGDELPLLIAYVLSMVVVRLGIDERDGKDEIHIGNPDKLDGAVLGVATLFQCSARARAVLPPEASGALDELARMRFFERILAVIDRERERIDRGLVASQNRLERLVSSSWKALAGTSETAPSLTPLLDPVGAFIRANAEKAEQTLRNRQEGYDAGLSAGIEQGRREERARNDAAARTPGNTVVVQPPAAPPASPAPETDPPGRRRADRGAK